jgi:hypothetical protein
VSRPLRDVTLALLDSSGFSHSSYASVFTYDRLKEADRRASGTDHCASKGIVFALKQLISNGEIRDPQDGRQALTAGRSVDATRGVIIYAVDQNFQINVGFDGVRGNPEAVKHETLFHNADVRAAGELEIDKGTIVEIGDISGTYGTAGRLQTDQTFADAVLTALDNISAPLDAAERRRLEERRAGRR